MLLSVICRHLMESREQGNGRKIMVCAPTNKAISVICNRFLAALNADESEFNVVLVGDDDKLLDDIPRENGSLKNLRSVFLYTWIGTLLDDYASIRRFVTGNEKKGANHYRELAGSLQNRLHRSLPGLSTEILEAANQVSVYLRNVHSSKTECSQRETLRALEKLSLAIRSWKKEAIWQQLVSSAHVVFCTLASAGAAILKRSLIHVDDLLVDEAAAATEPELYIPFCYSPKRLLAVGDPKQLPATVASQQAVLLGLSKSLHERLMYDCGKGHIMLDVQYRMKPELSQFPSNQFYEGKLINGPNVLR